MSLMTFDTESSSPHNDVAMLKVGKSWSTLTITQHTDLEQPTRKDLLTIATTGVVASYNLAVKNISSMQDKHNVLRMLSRLTDSSPPVSDRCPFPISRDGQHSFVVLRVGVKTEWYDVSRVSSDTGR